MTAAAQEDAAQEKIARERAAQKDAARGTARAVRAALSPDERASAARRLVDVFTARFNPPAGTVVSGYWPLGDEIDPRPLLAALRAAGCAVALPVTGAKASPLTFRLWDEDKPLAPGRFGALIPDAAQPETLPDVVLLPLLAFDRAGGRLGYGGGYYDRTLAVLRRAKAATAVGLAYAAQEIAETPRGPYDAPLDFIATEQGVICAAAL